MHWIHVHMQPTAERAPANLPNLLLFSFFDHFFCWSRVIVYSIKTHSTLLTPLSLQIGDSRCVEFWSNCPALFSSRGVQTYNTSVFYYERWKNGGILKATNFRFKKSVGMWIFSLLFPYISFSVSTEVIFW